MKGVYLKGAMISLIAASIIIGCGGGSGSAESGTTISTSGLVSLTEAPALSEITIGTEELPQADADSLIVDGVEQCGEITDISTKATVTKKNVSSKNAEDTEALEFEDELTYNQDDESRQSVNSHNTIDKMGIVLAARKANGDLIADADVVHPILIAYNEQVMGDYEMGDGSADIGDPDHVDGVFVSVSLDNGDSWKKYEITNTLNRQPGDIKSSIDVEWGVDEETGQTKTIAYPAHAQKPTMAIEGNKIVVAWHDKYCPSQNPLDLADDDIDYFEVNGSQSFIDYEGIEAPNGKIVYQVPFSCVWTSRGVLSTDDGSITWQTPMQLTTGLRDSNHIWIEGSSAGFAMAWQEDLDGLKSGKGAGPGEGWSGATTNHGSDIWYSSIKLADFEDEDVNFNYPVRITDNEMCKTDDKKPYCQYLCENYGYASLVSGNNKEDEIQRCATPYTDMLKDLQVILDGDTGASRPALRIFDTSAGSIVVLGYEETKGLSESLIADQDKGETDTDIELEGKSVYFESFKFDALDAFDPNNPASILDVQMPLVSAGKIVNVKVPEEGTGDMIYENARRLVIGTHVDGSNIGDDGRTFVFLYKQSFDTQGASSDMFIRANYGFTYDTFGPVDGRVVTNVSAQIDQGETVQADTYSVQWSEDNLNDNTYENGNENTFSPRIFLRGDNIYVGYAYTPSQDKTSQENMPSNFHIHRYLANAGGWQGPQNVTNVTKSSSTTVDARFFTTPQGSCATTGLQSDRSNPNVLFLTWGNIDEATLDSGETARTESDVYFRRSTDGGVTWSDVQNLATREDVDIEEKEVESLAAADGNSFFNAWLQEQEEYDPEDPFSGLDSWFGRVDYSDE